MNLEVSLDHALDNMSHLVCETVLHIIQVTELAPKTRFNQSTGKIDKVLYTLITDTEPVVSTMWLAFADGIERRVVRKRVLVHPDRWGLFMWVWTAAIEKAYP